MRIIHCAPFNIMTKTGGSLYANPIKISLGLVENGHYVHNFDYRDTARYFSLFKNKSGGIKKMNLHFKQVIDDIAPDLIIFGHAELIHVDTFHYIKSKNIKMIFWYNDMRLEHHFHDIGHLFDVVLITGAGSIIDILKQYNINSYFLPNPVNKNIESYKAFEQTQKHDLLFSGRKDSQRKELIAYIETYLNNININLIGQTQETTITGQKYFELINNTKICLNHNRDEYMVNKWYTSDRLMHVLGNGSFCLSRPIIDGEDFFEDKLDYYNTHDEMREKIYYYLENKEGRIHKTQWLYNRVHELFNTKKIGTYIIDLLNQNARSLTKYEWWHE